MRESSVSRRVRALEDALGVSLFERNYSGVCVTSAGAHFFNEIRDALARIDCAVRAAASAGQGSVGRVAVGISSSMAAGFLREAIRIYGERHPGVALNVREGASSTHLTMVIRRRLDVAFVSGSPDTANCQTTSLWTERIVVVLPQGHALCKKAEISWEALREQQLLLCTRDALYDELNNGLGDMGRRLRIRTLDVHRETLMHLVALHFGVGLTTEAAIATQFPDVVFRPLAGDRATIRYSAVWLSTNDNPAFRRFLSLARMLSKATSSARVTAR